jgi:hypothetical protein
VEFSSTDPSLFSVVFLAQINLVLFNKYLKGIINNEGFYASVLGTTIHFHPSLVSTGKTRSHIGGGPGRPSKREP